MKGLKRLANGQWNKDPGLYAARKIFFDALAESVELQPLGEFADFVNGTSYDTSLLRDDGVPIIRISNITDPNSPHLRTIQDFAPRFHVQHGDLLVSWSASFKSILWPNAHGILNQHIFKVTERQGFDRDYLRHAIEYVFDDLQEKTVGIGMMHLRRQDFLGHTIPAPPLNVQQEIANYLTWLESGADGLEPTTPLPEQQRIVARVKGLLVKVEEATRLWREVQKGVAALAWSIHAHAETEFVPVSELVTLRPTNVQVEATKKYHFAGVYSFGRGVFSGQTRLGAEFAYPRLTRLEAGNFTYPKLMAWEGALGVVPPECDGLVVSTEFPVFRINTDKILPEVLDAYFKNPDVWPQVSGDSTGTNVRRRRLNPSDFLAYPFPLPNRKTQESIAATWKAGQSLKTSHTADQELQALPASILAQAFAEAL